MSMYELPKLNFPQIKFLRNGPQEERQKKDSFEHKNQSDFWIIILVIFISSAFGFLAGIVSFNYLSGNLNLDLGKFGIYTPKKIVRNGEISSNKYIPQTDQERKIIQVVKEVSPSVVNIVITKDVPVFEEYYTNPFKGFGDFFGQPFNIPEYRQKGTERKKVGAGTGFIISKDGLILTNKHVVLDKNAQYTVLTNDGKKYSAKVLARDPIQDLAVVKINVKKPLPVVKIGDSSKLQVGQSVIAIGNALGEFKNTVSVGVISGLGRRINASGGGFYETLEDVIQTDAALNPGNSGGPLLNLKGEVIGINVATVRNGQTIGFSVPINKAKRDIEQSEKFGKISYPFLGVYYVMLNKEIKEKYNFPIDHGALVGWNPVNGKENEVVRTKIAVVPNSSADKAGIKRNDVILEVNGEKLTPKNSLGKVIMKYNSGDRVNLKIFRDGKIIDIRITLSERPE